jgi:PAS domain S-box-containing protein
LNAVKLISAPAASRDKNGQATIEGASRVGDVIPLAVAAHDGAKRAERDLRRSAARFGEFADRARFVGLVLDTDARIVYCNDYLLELTGWARAEIVGKNWFDYFLPEPHDELRSVFGALLQDSPEFCRYEHDVLTRGGERVRIRWNNVVLRSPTGEIIGTESIGEDLLADGRRRPNAPSPLRRSDVRDYGTAAQIVAIAEGLYWQPDHTSLTFLRMVADHCAQLAEECGETTSGAAVADHIRQMFRV